MSLSDRKQRYEKTLYSGTETATGTGSEVWAWSFRPLAIGFILDVTAAATDGSDTLDVKVQTYLGGRWLDVVAFVQVVGDATEPIVHFRGTAPPQYIFGVSQDLKIDDVDTALAAGNSSPLLGDTYRASWTIVDASTDNASFTFSVTAFPM